MRCDSFTDSLTIKSSAYGDGRLIGAKEKDKEKEAENCGLAPSRRDFATRLIGPTLKVRVSGTLLSVASNPQHQHQHQTPPTFHIITTSRIIICIISVQHGENTLKSGHLSRQTTTQNRNNNIPLYPPRRDGLTTPTLRPPQDSNPLVARRYPPKPPLLQTGAISRLSGNRHLRVHQDRGAQLDAAELVDREREGREAC